MNKITNQISFFGVVYLIILYLGLSVQVVADNNHRIDSHAPISIMGDHLHKEGEWMFSYRYMDMQMSDSYDGVDQIGNADILQDFMVTPTQMGMRMHMLGTMYAPSDEITLMLMGSYLDTDMDHLTRMGGTFTTETSGIGDISASALFNIQQSAQSNTHWTLGLSFPTGDIKERDDTPAGNARLPYPMQLGSGTYDLLTGITHKQFYTDSSWGLQAKARIATGENSLDYRLGHRYELNTWYSFLLSDNWSASTNLKYINQQEIEGADAALNPMMVPTARTDLRAGQSTDLGIGLNYKFTNGQRLALQFDKAVYQDLRGPQLARDWVITLGWQIGF